MAVGTQNWSVLALFWFDYAESPDFARQAPSSPPSEEAKEDMGAALLDKDRNLNHQCDTNQPRGGTSDFLLEASVLAPFVLWVLAPKVGKGKQN